MGKQQENIKVKMIPNKIQKSFLFSITFAIIIFTFTLDNVYAQPTPVSRWTLNGTLADSGPLNHRLVNSYPVYLPNNATSPPYFPFNPATIGHFKYVPEQFGRAIEFNGTQFFTTGNPVNTPTSSSDYSFIDYNHPFTVDIWTNATKHCATTNPPVCYHDYTFTKAFTTMPLSVPVGLGIGDLEDGSVYIYMDNPTAQFYAHSSRPVFDGNPHKITVTYSGSGVWSTAFHFYQDGVEVPEAPYDPRTSVPFLTTSISNNIAVVIGNYWYSNLNSVQTGWINKVQIFDVALTPQQVYKDYLAQTISTKAKVSSIFLQNGELFLNFGNGTSCKVLSFVNAKITCSPPG